MSSPYPFKPYRNIESSVVHGGIDGDPVTGAVNYPIYQTATFRQQGLGKNSGWEYSRSGNPTRAALESLVAELEGGVAGFAFASGLAAIATTLHLFQTGDKVVISNNVYGGTFRSLNQVFRQYGLQYEIVDLTDVASLDERFPKDAKAILIESPTNPLLDIIDIEAVSKVAKRHNALTIVDNTFLSPYIQRPIELGADIVIHSATKYLGGHSDLIAGIAVAKTEELAEQLGFQQNAVGAVLGPFDSFLLIRGIKTLSVRMDRHVANAEIIANYLKSSPAVEKIFYPGLPDHPGYYINKKQAKNGGAMISFLLRENYNPDDFFCSLKLIALAESLGGVESRACHPATMTHASVPYEVRQKAGVTDQLIRLSVGIENVDDLLDDLRQALQASEKK